MNFFSRMLDLLRSKGDTRSRRETAAQPSNINLCRHHDRSGRNTWRHRPQLQSLETRRLLVGEGEVFQLNETVSTAGLVGAISSTVDWSDGTTSAATVTGGQQTGGLTIRIDYSLDTAGFFASQSRRDLLQTAADGLVKRFSDDLGAIVPGGVNTWTTTLLHPATGAEYTLSDPSIAANEIVVFAGARELGGTRLGEGGPGAWGASGTQAWLDTVRGRGEAGALLGSPTDLAPWGGSITFDTTTNWFFGTDANLLGSTQDDFITVAQHELGHLLGIGTAPSWNTFVSGGTFNGPVSVAEYDGTGNVPLSGSQDHLATSVTEGGQVALLSPTITTGTRKLATAIDFALLDDIGWQVISTDSVITASHVFADNAVYPIELTVVGSDYGEITAPVSATVTNTSPLVTGSSNLDALAGVPVSITDLVSISDPGFRNQSASPATDETFEVAINWDDGSAIETAAATIDQFGSSGFATLASLDGVHTYSTPGTYDVVVVVTDDDSGSNQITFQIDVTGPPELALEISQSSFRENAGASASALTITRSGPVAESLVVDLVSSDPSEADLPASVAIPAGQSSVSVDVAAVDDTLLDGSVNVTLLASATGFVGDNVDVTVNDHETLGGAFNIAAVFENAPDGTLLLTLTRSNSDITAGLDVSVVDSLGQLAQPLTVTIPAGETTVTVAVNPVNDTVAEIPTSTSISVSAIGYVGVSIDLLINDDEVPAFQNPSNRYDVNGNTEVTVLDALRVINQLSFRDGVFAVDPAVEPFSGNYWDTNGDYLVTALDALLVINELSRRQRAMESEGEFAVDSLLAREDFDAVGQDYIATIAADSERSLF